jgi:gluconokinase
MFIVPPQEAERPLIIALDLGTSSVRAVLYDVRGRLVSGLEARVEYSMTTSPDGGVEINADDLVDFLCQVVDSLLEQARKAFDNFGESLCGVACCTFWHSIIGVGADAHAVTPLYNWNDTRSASDAAALGRNPGREWLHSRTGALPHASYYPAKIRWLRRTRPNLIVRIARWLSIGEYFYERIFGRAVCSASMASGTGLLNPNLRDWDGDVLRELEIGLERLSPVASETETVSGLRKEFAERWPELRDVPWVPAIGDGAASNVGSGCTTPARVAINVGTSGAMRVCWKAESVKIPPGLWCYLVDRSRFVMGGALSNGGDVFAWCQRVLRLDAEKVEAGLRSMDPDGHGLTVLPFFSGERSTGWADYARASIHGMTLSTGPMEILRASIESVAYRFAAIYDLVNRELNLNATVIASGGGILNSKGWTQIMADVIGVPVVASTAPEASSRGAALQALEVLGRITDLSDVEVPLGETFEPRTENRAVYDQGRKRQEQLYDLLVRPGPGVIGS